MHLLGVVILMGNVTVTAFWKVFADRTGDARLIAHAQHGVTVSDWLFTVLGIALLGIGGYGMAWIANIDLLGPAWLVWGQVLFFVSGLIWLAILVPTQYQQARKVRTFDFSQSVPEDYQRLSRRWIFWGVVATIPLLFAMILMIGKPG